MDNLLTTQPNVKIDTNNSIHFFYCVVTNVSYDVISLQLTGLGLLGTTGAVAPLLVEADLSLVHARVLTHPLNMAGQTVLGTQASSNKDVTHQCVQRPA